MSLPADYERPIFDLPAALPFAPGSSPFRVAGVVYRGLFEFIEEHVPGGLKRVRSELHQPELERFLEARFAVSSWYDVTPVPYLGQAVARARGVSFARQVQDANRWSEERAGVIYRALLVFLSADRIASALPRAAAVVHDFGKVYSQPDGPHRIVGRRVGVPRPLVRWLVLSHATYLELALRRLGASSVRVEFGPPERDGQAAGVETYQLPFTLAWA